MKYQIDKNDKSKQSWKILDEGKYPARIVKVLEHVDERTGKDYIELWFDVIDKQGEVISLPTWVSEENAGWKLKHLAYAIGKTASYESGEFNRLDYEGGELIVDVVCKSDKTGKLKNYINAFLPFKENACPAQSPPEKKHDDIPF